MIRKYIIVADDSIKGFDGEIAKLEREWGAEEIEPCKDCISRQAVLDKKELVELDDGQSFYCINPKDVETLPSVTPTISKMEQVEDCISREQAIEKSKPEFLNDNVVRETEKETIANQNYNKGWNDCNHEWIDILSKLPSVTPQPFINKPCVSEGVCREDKIKVLDKIRAEIVELRSRQNVGVLECLDIIDKYKAESEDME